LFAQEIHPRDTGPDGVLRACRPMAAIRQEDAAAMDEAVELR
jgi:hypothetical protein